MFVPAWGIFLMGVVVGIVVGIVGTVLVALNVNKKG